MVYRIDTEEVSSRIRRLGREATKRIKDKSITKSRGKTRLQGPEGGPC